MPDANQNIFQNPIRLVGTTAPMLPDAPDHPVDVNEMVVATSGGEAEKVAPSPASLEPAVTASPSIPAVVAGSTVSDIDLEIPAFLRRPLSDNSVPSVPVAFPRAQPSPWTRGGDG
jgi:hypothetical protein